MKTKRSSRFFPRTRAAMGLTPYFLNEIILTNEAFRLENYTQHIFFRTHRKPFRAIRSMSVRFHWKPLFRFIPPTRTSNRSMLLRQWTRSEPRDDNVTMSRFGQKFYFCLLRRQAPQPFHHWINHCVLRMLLVISHKKYYLRTSRVFAVDQIMLGWIGLDNIQLRVKKDVRKATNAIITQGHNPSHENSGEKKNNGY